MNIQPLLSDLSSYKNIRVRGLMVIAPKTEGYGFNSQHFCFAGYRAFTRLQAMYPKVDLLSMGMSGDYQIAVEEGANIVRVGTALLVSVTIA